MGEVVYHSLLQTTFQDEDFGGSSSRPQFSIAGVNFVLSCTAVFMGHMNSEIFTSHSRRSPLTYWAIVVPLVYTSLQGLAEAKAL
ncbi:hypothetical protein J6590_073838 [Homalodisca vitripennis]|nr:hypothetical protein J6590_073838 [Homalodisca vitripennis]